MVIFRILRVGLTDSQLTPRARWDSYRGAIVNVIEGCVVFPVLLLNIINACSQYYGSQNAVSEQIFTNLPRLRRLCSARLHNPRYPTFARLV